MTTDVLTAVSDVVIWCVTTFNQIMAAVGAAAIYIAAVFMVLSVRYLLAPLLGRAFSAGSDLNKKKRGEQ